MTRKFPVLKIVGTVLLIGAIILSSACLPGTKDEAGLKKVTDADGTVVAIREKPQQIVSLGTSVDDILAELVPPERIAALTYLADDSGISSVPEKTKQQIKKRAYPNPESILSLKPDLVIIPSWQPKELVQAMRDVGVTVYVCQTGENVAQIKDNIREIANIVGEAEQGNKLIAQMDAVLNDVAGKVKDIEEGDRLTGLRFSTMGAGTFSTFDDICRYAGVKNGAAIAGVKQSQVMSKEQIIMVNPDFFLLPTWDSSKKTDLNQYKKDIESDPAFKNVKAIQNKRLYHVPDKYLYSTSQYIITAIKEVAKAAYPQLFEVRENAQEKS